jgi:hypothetical protein
MPTEPGNPTRIASWTSTRPTARALRSAHHGPRPHRCRLPGRPCQPTVTTASIAERVRRAERFRLSSWTRCRSASPDCSVPPKPAVSGGRPDPRLTAPARGEHRRPRIARTAPPADPAPPPAAVAASVRGPRARRRSNPSADTPLPLPPPPLKARISGSLPSPSSRARTSHAASRTTARLPPRMPTRTAVETALDTERG